MEFQDKSLALTTRDLIANYIIGFQLFPYLGITAIYY